MSQPLRRRKRRRQNSSEHPEQPTSPGRRLPTSAAVAKRGDHSHLVVRRRNPRQKGQPVATVGGFRDTRESDSLASRLREATNRLIHSEKRSAAVALAGATAHELNQPLTSVMGIVELILATDTNESTQNRLDRAYEQLERMAEIVRDLSKVTQYKTTQYVEGVNILDLHQESE